MASDDGDAVLLMICTLSAGAAVSVLSFGGARSGRFALSGVESMVHQTMATSNAIAAPASRKNTHAPFPILFDLICYENCYEKMMNQQTQLTPSARIFSPVGNSCSKLISVALFAAMLAACQTTPPTPAPTPTPTVPSGTSPKPTTPALPPSPSKPPSSGGQTSPTSPTTPSVVTPPELLKLTQFSQLPNWEKDDVREAWPAFMASCTVLIRRTEWKEPCTIARTVDARNGPHIRTFFETFFAPHLVNNPDGTEHGLVTGYYEPLLRGSRKRAGQYQVPLYKVPEDLLTVDLGSIYPELKNMRLRGRLVGNKVVPYGSRAELETSPAMNGKELLWVDDAIDAFFLQVQGSGRVQIDGTKEVVRVAYADQNGYPYKSIGRYLVDKGELKLEQASMQGIRAWALANPHRAQEMYNANPSYVFFKEEKLPDPKVGPKGALGVPLTGQRSIAIDPTMIPLGAPMYLATTQPNSDIPLQRLMVAQDTGGAIRGAVRADFFWGFGAEAGEKAGKMKQRGQIWVLLPK